VLTREVQVKVVKVENEETLVPLTFPYRNGHTFPFGYSCPTPGTVRISVSVELKPVRGSPFTAVVRGTLDDWPLVSW
jgi:hypothetical protein